MTCAICGKSSKGFGWRDPTLRGQANSYQFCSRRCQDVFARLMAKTEGSMIDSSDLETMARQACLGPLGDFVAATGIERPLATYRREDVLRLIDVVITAYQACLYIEYERIAERDHAFLMARLARARHLGALSESKH